MVRRLRAKRHADFDNDVDEPAGAEHTPEPSRAVGHLLPCPRREAGGERRPRIGMRRAMGQNGYEPTAERDEQRAIRKLHHRKAGRPTVLTTPPEIPEREPGVHPRDPSDVTPASGLRRDELLEREDVALGVVEPGWLDRSEVRNVAIGGPGLSCEARCVQLSERHALGLEIAHELIDASTRKLTTAYAAGTRLGISVTTRLVPDPA